MDGKFKMEVKKILHIIFIIISFSLYQGCSETQPKKNDIAGVWLSRDGAIIEFKKDGTFIAKHLPAKNFISDDENSEKRFDCYLGKWAIKESARSLDQFLWFVELNFVKNSVTDYNNTVFSLVISGSNFMENKAPWKKLFNWIGDPDSGNRYEFSRK